ncbi:MAG: CoA-binding protein, partial [Burkholderiaceae bacterium]|nr:CoA-binding protein [Burkholderiaceae bacterium]
MDSASTAASARAGVEALLKPRSVAIVGATPRVEALGGRPIVNLRTQGFTGKIYPVNPRYESILGLPCYPDLKSLPEVPDLVLVLVSQDRVFATLDEALEVGARTALVFGGGFAEMAGEGVARQDRLKSYAGRGLRICGPNCNGVFSVVNKTALGFAPTFEFPARQGRIAIISQSGAINTSISSRAMDMGLGFSHLIASGNEADLEAADYVEYLLDDPATEVFVLYIEGFKNPARFLRVAQEALRRGKPIVLMKMGRTPSSQHVALSHTGSMTGSYEVIVGALRQRGVIVVESMDDLCGVASVLASGKRPQGGAMAVVSLSGGMAG